MRRSNRRGTRRVRRLCPGVTRFVAVTVSAALLSGAAHAGDPVPADKKPEQPALLWTREPVRVKPADMALPRLSGKEHIVDFPAQLAVPKTVRVKNSISFTIDGVQYQVAGLEPVPPDMICKSESGVRTACGLRARMQLRNLISGRLLRCRDHEAPAGTAVLVDCVLGAERLADRLVAAGAAFAGDPALPDLARKQTAALRHRKGIWSDHGVYTAHQVPTEPDTSD